MPVVADTEMRSGETDCSASTAIVPAVRVEVCPHPFSFKRQTHHVPKGESVYDLLDTIGLRPRSCERYAVCIDGVPIPESQWEWLPASTQEVTIRCVPRGGGGDGKSIGTLVAGMLLIASAVVVGVVSGWTGAGLTAAGYLGSIGMSLVFSGLAGLLAPSPIKPKSYTDDPVATITGAQNQANPFGAIPRVLGFQRVYPPLGGNPYTELYDNDQYLRMLFVVGYGPMEISDVKIGETSIDEYSDIEWDSWEGRATDDPPAYYTQDVQEETFSILLPYDGSYEQRTTTADTEEIIVDIVFPAGLARFNRKGERKSLTVTITAEYSIKDAGSWTDFSPPPITATTGATLRKSIRVAVAKNIYDVRIKRSVTDDPPPSNQIEEARWTVLRSVKLSNPVNTTKNLAMISVRIRATNQLNGVINQLNCLAKSYLQVYDGATWSEALSNNPAWCYVSVLTDAANAQAMPFSRLDADALKDWADWCTTNGFAYNRSIDEKRTVFELLRQITAAGRATFHMRDELYSVVRDVAQTVPVQHITPRNSWGYSGQKLFSGGIHAVRVEFVNEEANYQPEERVVYADGYSEVNATIIEKLDLPGVTNPDQVWKLGRYHIAQLILRPEVHKVSMDIESLVCSRGDLVEFVHDVVKFGLGQARILTVVIRQDGACTGLTFDEVWTHEVGKLYSVRIRNKNGDSILQDVQTILADNEGVTFETPIPAGELQPAEGDLILFGERNATGVRMLVKSIDPQSNLTATLELVDEAPAVLTADSGTIPPFNTRITEPAPFIQVIPPAPVIVSFSSDEAIMDRGPDGSLRSRLGVSLFVPGNTRYIGSYFFQVQFRLNMTTDPWVVVPLVPIDQSMVIIDQVEDGLQYEVRARTTNGREHSDWSQAVAHTIVGKSSLPPDVTDLFVERQSDGTRVFTWTFDDPPPDIDGFVLKYQLGPSGTWVTGLPLHTSVIKASPFETNQLAAGQYTFMIKAVDTAGNESQNAVAVISTIGDPRLAGALVQVRPRAEGWPGTKTNCFVDTNGELIASGTVTWDDFQHELFFTEDIFSLGMTESTGDIVPTSP